MQSGLLLNVVVSEGAAILELLTGEDQALLIRRNSCNNASGNGDGYPAMTAGL